MSIKQDFLAWVKSFELKKKWKEAKEFAVGDPYRSYKEVMEYTPVVGGDCFLWEIHGDRGLGVYTIAPTYLQACRNFGERLAVDMRRFEAHKAGKVIV